VIVSADGYLLTNNHVIDGASDIEVMLSDGRQARATLVGSDGTKMTSPTATSPGPAPSSRTSRRTCATP
jgi:hypothetical protein